MTPANSNIALVDQMAAELVRRGTWRDERDAIRTLSRVGFASGDIMLQVDAAMARAAEVAAIESKVREAVK